MDKQKLIIYWSRRDFRTIDNPALYKSIEKTVKTKSLFVPIFILEDYMVQGDPGYQFGYPSQFFLAKSLPLFAENFENFIIFKGNAIETFKNLQAGYDIEIFINEDIHTDFYKQVIKLQKLGISVTIFNDQLTVSKQTFSGTGGLYSVFSPFKKNVWQSFLDYPEVPTSEPKSIPKEQLLNSAEFKDKITPNTYEKLISTFGQTRQILIAGKIVDISKIVQIPDLNSWYWSEKECLNLFNGFLNSGLLSQYKQNRDSLKLDTEILYLEDGAKFSGKTSKMSLGLAWGLISARTIKNKILAYYKDQNFSNFHSTSPDQGVLCFLSELIWREFYKYIYFHKPDVMNTEFQSKFRGTIDWVEEKEALKRFESWIRGETGYEVVDAAMNQLAKTGWMHNRSRMIVASVLTKNLGVDWRWGQEYFRATLIDLDEASNNGGWQWGASVGADPKPIRIFNPYLQQENYDKNKDYIHFWLPAEYDIKEPIIEHKLAREQAMKRYGLGGVKPRDY
jgi:deoxyribodipyrimidine photo-lyase